MILVFECLLSRLKAADDTPAAVFLCKRYGYSSLRKLNITVLVKDELWYHLRTISLTFQFDNSNVMRGIIITLYTYLSRHSVKLFCLKWFTRKMSDFLARRDVHSNDCKATWFHIPYYLTSDVKVVLSPVIQFSVRGDN